MNSILQTIVTHKKEEVAFAKKSMPQAALETSSTEDSRDFAAALADTTHPGIIAEIKKASPSKGLIRADFEVGAIAEIYERHGARCLSVLTDTRFFQGAPENIRLAKAHSKLPVLRKDFIIDSYQIHESKALGADCILLIAAILDDSQLLDFYQIANALGMAVLVESHTQEELLRAIELPTPLMGINNRSLHTFTTCLQTSIELAQLLPADKWAISESGIHTREDLDFLSSKGISRFLIGESLMQAANIGEKLDSLLHLNYNNER